MTSGGMPFAEAPASLATIARKQRITARIVVSCLATGIPLRLRDIVAVTGLTYGQVKSVVYRLHCARFARPVEPTSWTLTADGKQLHDVIVILFGPASDL